MNIMLESSSLTPRVQGINQSSFNIDTTSTQQTFSMSTVTRPQGVHVLQAYPSVAQCSHMLDAQSLKHNIESEMQKSQICCKSRSAPHLGRIAPLPTNATSPMAGRESRSASVSSTHSTCDCRARASSRAYVSPSWTYLETNLWCQAIGRNFIRHFRWDFTTP